MAEEVLQSFGLSENAKAVYFKLVQTGLCTADDIVNKLQQGQDVVLKALEELSQKGIVTPIIEKDKQCFRPADINQLRAIASQLNKS